ncbi:hypothetical protein PM082_012464 [Marasmius tenuissimus]|nr:hypothetical protein PM082_012464 [Marasmius tenuissimus]
MKRRPATTNSTARKQSHVKHNASVFQDRVSIGNVFMTPPITDKAASMPTPSNSAGFSPVTNLEGAGGNDWVGWLRMEEWGNSEGWSGSGWGEAQGSTSAGSLLDDNQHLPSSWVNTPEYLEALLQANPHSPEH